jgi:type IV secretory pathway TraG/TraD family ATPase VirD4
MLLVPLYIVPNLGNAPITGFGNCALHITANAANNNTANMISQRMKKIGR